ncbi:HEPN domain-containing protein [Trichocoleus sp. ST-U3]
MTEDQLELLLKAWQSLSAARLLLDNGFPDYATSRAYYTMFYIASAFLEGEGMSFSSHAEQFLELAQNLIGTLPPNP